ncbi:hypothetical protein DSO57_1030423 [Entomophthora muscae]|uniref:Uncharacterized protein n=1 Tax=Entomophthora muscae TaxID=34485 RepID=A0ACC2T0X1_9FUNG|nr:hypothetical protein DSO57_1030423 [Entomophthora muscae]
MKPSKVQLATIFTILEESVHQLWTLQPPVESEVEFSYGIHVLNSNSQDSSSRSDNTGIDPNHKPLFKKGFNPKTSTITFFLALYEIEMCMLMMGIKKITFYIFFILHAMSGMTIWTYLNSKV